MATEKKLEKMNDLVALCKRRGFIFQSSEIYGGIGSCWDYGPLGVELKLNIRDSWWKAMTYQTNIEGIDTAIFMHPQVWRASGHVDNFTDPLVDCKACKVRFRADKIDLKAPCPHCKAEGHYTSPRDFNLMFKTRMGPVEDSSADVFLRPETAQGIFVNFLNVQQTMRKKLPFGIAQIGKAFRNEITPGHFIFRTREFEQMEMQYFILPGTQGENMERWKEERFQWHIDQGLSRERLRFHQHGKDELAHYADQAFDIEYQFPIGWQEMEGIHSRTDFDLVQHEAHCKKSLHYVDQQDHGKKFLPYVLETSVGLDRHLLSLLCDAYCLENPGERDQRLVLRLSHRMSPIKVAIMPLMKKPELAQVAEKLVKNIQNYYKIEYDTAGSIGKRYRRQDEIGTPFCLTVDYDTLEDQTVTIRDRDTMEQIRLSMDKVLLYLKDRMSW